MEFKEIVWELTKKIPKGKVITYKELAAVVSSQNAGRAVGNALNKNPHWPNVPCHRVIKSDGSMGGFSKGKEEKLRLLKKEGVILNNEKIKPSKIIDRHFFRRNKDFCIRR
ncbi:MAG: MGMT family protein [Nanoarchaeota archaeon]